MTSILESIGNTPLVRLRRCVPENGAELWVKLEYLNPTGSMKDRMALAMIEGAERDGLLAAGDTVVEYTGGSTGPALAFVCNAKGYRPLIVMADCFTEERFQLLRALGAEIDVVRSVRGRPHVTADDIRNMVARAAELAQRPRHYATNQFENPYIIPAHRDGLGREIWEQTGGRVTAFTQGVGTATALLGVSEALRPRGVVIQALEPAGSPALGRVEGRLRRRDRGRRGDRDDRAARPRGGDPRRHLDGSECRRRAPSRRAPRPRRGDRHARSRHRVQVHERQPVRRPVTTATRMNAGCVSVP
jgi:cysteine synthase